jgi:GTP cyclohydrolase I
MSHDDLGTTDGTANNDLNTDDGAGETDREKAQRGTRLLLEAMGEDPDRDGLVETWRRRVPDLTETLSEGYETSAKPEMRTFETDSQDLLIKTGIPLHSVCEHHLLPYTGTIHIAYRPNGEVVGLSKLTRYVRWRARRLTIQEELTRDIAEGLADEINAETVLVQISAQHMCEAMRGIETVSTTTTFATAGSPTDSDQERFNAAIAQETET